MLAVLALYLGSTLLRCLFLRQLFEEVINVRYISQSAIAELFLQCRHSIQEIFIFVACCAIENIGSSGFCHF